MSAVELELAEVRDSAESERQKYLTEQHRQHVINFRTMWVKFHENKKRSDQ